MGTTARRPEHKSYFPGRKASCIHIRTAATSQPGSFADRGESTKAVLNPGIIVRNSSRDSMPRNNHLHQPQPSSTIGRSTQNSSRIRQVESSSEGCRGKGKKGTAKQRSAERQSNQHDLSEEALVVEGKIEGYLVRKDNVNERIIESVRAMLQHCYTHPSWQGLKQLKAILSTIYGMVKFLTPWGIASLVSQMPIIFECMGEGKKQAIERPKETEQQERYEQGTKNNHQSLPQCQPISDTGQSEEEGILLQKKAE
ncbi:hypothetical protein Tco_1254229 [Tanacetum coccineum]